MQPPRYTLAEYVEHMTTSGWISQTKLAEHMGVSPATLSQYVRGVRAPSEDVRRRIVVLTGGSVTFDILADRAPNALARS